MYIKDQSVDISINYKVYEEILNNIRCKAPVEIGVEVAVYMLLFGLLENTNHTVVDVNSMWRKKAKVYSINSDKEAGFEAVPDLVIVSNKFSFQKKNSKNLTYGFVEVKALSEQYSETKEIESHMKNTNHLIWTNGLEWHYFNQNDQTQNWKVDLTSSIDKEGTIIINETKYAELLNELSNIGWEK